MTKETWTLLGKKGKKEVCENTVVQISFLKKPILIKKKLHPNRQVEYSQINIKLNSKYLNTKDDCNIDLDLEFKLKMEEDDSYRIWNYSFIITAFSLLKYGIRCNCLKRYFKTIILVVACGYILFLLI